MTTQQTPIRENHLCNMRNTSSVETGGWHELRPYPIYILMVSFFPHLPLVYCLYEEQTPYSPLDHQTLKSKYLISEENSGNTTALTSSIPLLGDTVLRRRMDLCMERHQYTTLFTDHGTTITIL